MTDIEVTYRRLSVSKLFAFSVFRYFRFFLNRRHLLIRHSSLTISQKHQIKDKNLQLFVITIYSQLTHRCQNNTNYPDTMILHTFIYNLLDQKNNNFYSITSIT